MLSEVAQLRGDIRDEQDGDDGKDSEDWWLCDMLRLDFGRQGRDESIEVAESMLTSPKFI